MKSDRFILNLSHRKNDFLHISSEKQILNADQDPKVNKLYRLLVIQGRSSANENYCECKSLKKITDSQYNEDSTINNFSYLQKIGLDFSKVNLEPAIINKPDRILEALSLTDNFYLNLLDCSQASVLAVGLSRGIYLWKPVGSINRIRQAPDIASIQWNPKHTQLIGCGTKKGKVQVWDAEKNKCLSNYDYHIDRVGTLAWLQDSNSLLSGGKDSNIYAYDMRHKKKIAKYKFHDQEICSLKVQSYYSNSTNEYFASGSNDKNLAIWNIRMKKPQLIYKHSAAIKGISWHPSKNGILASGGGTQDRSIRIWNTTSNQLIKTVNTGSQICNLKFIKGGDQLVSTHGFNRFETNIWETNTMKKKVTLLSHTKRVLYLASEPDGQTIVTGAGDETIRFWKLKEDKKGQSLGVQENIMTIR